MMSYAFNAHDEYFRPDPAYPPVEMYALHPRDELEETSRAALRSTASSSRWSASTPAPSGTSSSSAPGLARRTRCWATLFFDWRAAAWTPATARGARCTWSTTCRRASTGTSASWTRSARGGSSRPSIAIGGHVRVGWEDNPYLPNGELAQSNAELVEVVVEHAAGDRPRGRHAGRGARDHGPDQAGRGACRPGLISDRRGSARRRSCGRARRARPRSSGWSEPRSRRLRPSRRRWRPARPRS